MKHLELHILQSVPVACLNRDDLNSPKTAIFGGVQRARVSSQCWKSAIREFVNKNELSKVYNGDRTKLLVQKIVESFDKKDLKGVAALYIAEHIADMLATIDSKKDSKGYYKVSTLFFLSPLEIESITDSVKKIEKIGDMLMEIEKNLSLPEKDDSQKKIKKEELEKIKKKVDKEISETDISKAIKSVALKDAADIALFGRMVANDHSLTVEAAAMFSHALSTHKVDNELDFFAAIDDLQPKEDAGAGMTGTLEFNSATYYRFAAVNLEMLKDNDHLGISMSADERKNVMRAFIKATLMAMPVARKYSMNANTLPGYVLGIVREKGHPIQLVNAFEKPIKPQGGAGIFEESKTKLNSEYNTLKTTWKLDELKKVSFPGGKIKGTDGKEKDMDIDEFVDGLVAYVE
ncbi:MAG TPA: type I-E CRISPR-associated protein Cas7/Cse4/CasC [Fibrobacteres bacterium]|jgi:CRISPR system Cascade subunit CasC|nr:type I-E CRISPR-associated protein Cas7/Cse4/CasC [Fibrobacterota bacterium]